MVTNPFDAPEDGENPEPRLPSVLILDVSASMAGEPIDELNQALRVYRDELLADPVAAQRIEIAVVAFGEEVLTINDFASVESWNPPTLVAGGETPTGQAVQTGLMMLETRRHEYRDAGLDVYRPWVFLITDGEPTDPDWEIAAGQAVDGERRKVYAFFAVGVQDANMTALANFSVRKPMHLRGLAFRDLFQWIAASQRNQARSTPGEGVPLSNPTGPNGWAEAQPE